MPLRLQFGSFDIHERTANLTEMINSLVRLKEKINRQALRPSSNVVYEQARKTTAGTKPIDVVYCSRS